MLDSYSERYVDARAKFLGIARTANAPVKSVIHPTLGRDGEELAMDFATFGDPQAEKCLLLVSGTHGQEGYAGSAIQIDFLRDLQIPDGVKVVALHGLNPWGFSYLSRTDDLNIDVNRNFLDFTTPLPSNPIYVDAHPLVCPDDWLDERPSASELAATLVGRHGMGPALSALTGGQFDEPTGLNFGGRAPAWSNRMVTEHLPPLLASSKKVAFVEWHTGLGEFGELCYICMHPPQSDAYERVCSWIGEDGKASFSAAFEGDGLLPTYNGLFSSWLPNAAPLAEWAGLVVEVGTFDNPTVWDALRTDRWLKFGRGVSSRTREELRRVVIEGLYPSSSDWRRNAITGGRSVQKRLLSGLLEW
ncbi:MAG: DUF2817 domain-containing protein [Sphingomonas sp.]|uniref:DUF2817 domain-containing protein n=1 Tax=Sphingomonas sp. TaxID=28214 RepID=UPI003F801E88